jgi:hypothetical protein
MGRAFADARLFISRAAVVAAWMLCDDEQAYHEAARFRMDLWNEIDVWLRVGWRTPWFASLPNGLRDGDGIFTAVADCRHQPARPG